MRSKTLLIGLAVIAISALIVGIAVVVISNDLRRKEANTKEQEKNESWVIPSEDELLGKYEKSDRLFKRDVTDNKIIYWHQRKIDNATVEKDFINYQFDKNTQELIKKTVHWRGDLPEQLPPVIPKEQAEAIAGGGSATLYFIDPESNVFPIKPVPKNPCWIVWKTIKTENGIPYSNITIVDAVEGKILGYGIPPP